MTGPKILFIDLESAPTAAYVWKRWDNNVAQNQVIHEGYIMSWAAKWLGSDTIYFDSLYRQNVWKNSYPEDDSTIVSSCLELMDEADIVVAHNALKFDIPTLYARAVFHGYSPPNPTRVVDTLQVARKHFRFPSNKLDSLCQYFGIGEKTDTGGFDLWTGCMKGDKASWALMEEYNCQDVELLEQLYLRLRPYMTQHPNVALYSGSEGTSCPKCGSHDIQYRGYSYTLTQRYHKFQCNSCGGWGRERTTAVPPEQRKTLATNAGMV